MAINLELSRPFLLPTATNDGQPERQDSLISLKRDDEYDSPELPKSAHRPLSETFAQTVNEEESPAVTVEELKRHVHIHAKEINDERTQEKYGQLFNCEMNDGIAKPIESRGRKKMLTAVH